MSCSSSNSSNSRSEATLLTLRQQPQTAAARKRYYKMMFLGFIVLFYQMGMMLFQSNSVVLQPSYKNNNDGVDERRRSTTILPLSQLTVGGEEEQEQASNKNNCSQGLFWIGNIIDKTFEEEDTATTTTTTTTLHQRKNKIPRIIHQTCKTRCVTPAFVETIQTWQQFGKKKQHGGGWSYFLHDDEAMMRLFHADFVLQEFPHLRMVLDNCMVTGTIRADLWRYIVLYVYGGIYADLDSVPNSLNETWFAATDEKDSNNHDAFFVVEAYGLLSQYFMAASPRHPIMWYAIQDSLANLLLMQDTRSTPAHAVTGPHALHRAFAQFRKDAGVIVGDQWSEPVRTGGLFAGTNNRTITVVGTMNSSDDIVIREAMLVGDRDMKQRDYKEMGMRHYHEEMWKMHSNKSCLSSVYSSMTS